MENKTSASIHAKGLQISTKMSVEICKNIRNKPLAKAKIIVGNMVNMKQAIKVRRYLADLGHKPGMGPGRFPIAAGKVFLKMFDSIQSNAENQGMNVNNLVITTAQANKADARYHNGRKGRTRMKNTHLFLVVEEKSEAVKK
jgi:large subunit ribosomal protein L22